MIRRLGLVAAVALANFAASAQTPPPKAPPTPTPTLAPAPSAVVGPPPYERQLARLAEMFGALTYLRDLCGAGDGAAFRERMARLVDSVSSAPEMRDSLAGAFNRGFSDYELTYRRCTPSARETIANYLDESARVAHDISIRYGG